MLSVSFFIVNLRVMLKVIILSVLIMSFVVLSVAKLVAVMLTVFKRCAIMPNAVVPGDIMLIVIILKKILKPKFKILETVSAKSDNFKPLPWQFFHYYPLP
jgi:hypothetical protein